MTAFVLTGRCPGIERDPLERRINAAGHAVLSKIPGRLYAANTVLVASDEAMERGTSKVRSAAALGIPIWSYSQLLTMLDRNGAPPARVTETVHIDHIPFSTGPATARRVRLGDPQPAFRVPIPASTDPEYAAFRGPTVPGGERIAHETNFSRQIRRAPPPEPVPFTGRTIKRSL